MARDPCVIIPLLMPITKSAKKALRVSERRREINTRVRSTLKSTLKTFLAAPSADKLSEAFSRIDRAVKGKVMHRNTAARRKSRLARLVASGK